MALVAIAGCSETVPFSKAAGLLQLVIEGIESEALLVLLERHDTASQPPHCLGARAFTCSSGYGFGRGRRRFIKNTARFRRLKLITR